MTLAEMVKRLREHRFANWAQGLEAAADTIERLASENTRLKARMEEQTMTPEGIAIVNALLRKRKEIRRGLAKSDYELFIGVSGETRIDIPGFLIRGALEGALERVEGDLIRCGITLEE